MKPVPLLLVTLFATTLPACGVTEQDKSAREWQRAECNRILDREDRERCMKRIE